MALTTSRWIACVAIVFALVTAATLAADPPSSPTNPASSDGIDPQLRRRVVTAARRWEALVRRDSVTARLGRVARAGAAREPRVLIDPLLPAPNRSVIERAVARQWSSLRIGNGRVPVAIAVVVDTITSDALPRGGRGQIAYDYVLPTAAGGNQGCVAIIALQSRGVVRPGTHHVLAEEVATPRSASSLLGPCAFFARFGMPGEGIARWLSARSYDLAASPDWMSAGGSNDGLAVGERWRQVNAGAPASKPYWLSPDALACTAAELERCTATLLPDADKEPARAGELVMMHTSRDPHWGSLNERYLADLVTAMGPERFERFWRSELEADAALRAAAGVSLAVWTHEWASGLLGAHRIGPGLSLTEMLGALVLAGLFLSVAAWGWGRRQVR